jgi:hypothetical protein
MSRNSRLKFSASILIGVGLLLLGLRLMWPLTMSQDLSEPISLRKGEVLSGEYVGDGRDALAEIEVRPNEEHVDSLDCFLGVGNPIGSCTQGILDVDWQILAGSHVVASGHEDRRGNGGFGRRYLNVFRTNQGQPYRVWLLVNEDASLLDQGRPRLQVSVSPSVLEAEIFLYGYLFIIGCALIAAGSVLFFIGRSSGRHTLMTTPSG